MLFTMAKTGRSHLRDPRFDALVVILVCLGPTLVALGAIAFSGVLRVAVVVFGLLVVVFLGRAVVEGRRSASRRKTPIRDRVTARQALDAQLVEARALHFESSTTTALLVDAWQWGELATVQQVAAEVLSFEAKLARRRTDVRDGAAVFALALDALARCASGDVEGASRQLADYDQRRTNELSTALYGAHHRAYAEVARAWLRFRQGDARGAVAGLRAARTAIAGQAAALRSVADALVRASDRDANPARSHYRASSRAQQSEALLQASHTHLEPRYPSAATADDAALLALDRSLEPLPLPAPFATRPRWWWLPWLVAAPLLAATMFAVRTQRPFLMFVAAIASCVSMVQGFRVLIPAPSRDTRAEDAARFADAEASVDRDRVASIAALEALANRKHGLVAAEAAVRRAAVACIEGDATAALRWNEHALATMHHLTAMQFRVAALRAQACAERAVLFAALDRPDDAERTLLLLRGTPTTAAFAAWCSRLVTALRSRDDDRARALARAAPLASVNGFAQLLCDAALATDDESIADDLRVRLADWPDGCRYLQVLVPRCAGPLLPRVPATSVALD